MLFDTGSNGAILAGLASLGFLAACTSAGTGGLSTVQSVPFEGPVTDADYVGKSFPVFVLVGEAGDPSGGVNAGKGLIRYDSEDQVTVTLPGAAPIVLERTGSTGLGTSFRGTAPDSSTVTALISNVSGTNAFRIITSAESDFAVLGGFGFETTAADRQGLATATYDTAGAVFLTAENVENFLPVAGEGRLVANFGEGSISGTLLSSDSVEVRLAGEAGTPDELALDFIIENGVINEEGFTGDVRATGELVVDGSGAPLPLDASMVRDSTEGAFFGEEAAAVSGTFEGDLSLREGGMELGDFEAAGFFAGGKD